MTQTGMKPMVLARFPIIDLADKEEARGATPDSKGRILGQAMSFKLLAASVLVLVVGSVAPWAWKQSNSSESSTSEPAITWQNRPPKAAVEAAPVCVTAAPMSAAAQQSPSPALRVASKPPIATVSSAATATTGASLMSAWPNPNHPTQGDAEVKTNQSMAIRPEYLRSRP